MTDNAITQTQASLLLHLFLHPHGSTFRTMGMSESMAKKTVGQLETYASSIKRPILDREEIGTDKHKPGMREIVFRLNPDAILTIPIGAWILVLIHREYANMTNTSLDDLHIRLRKHCIPIQINFLLKIAATLDYIHLEPIIEENCWVRKRPRLNRELPYLKLLSEYAWDRPSTSDHSDSR